MHESGGSRKILQLHKAALPLTFGVSNTTQLHGREDTEVKLLGSTVGLSSLG